MKIVARGGMGQSDWGLHRGGNSETRRGRKIQALWLAACFAVGTALALYGVGSERVVSAASSPRLYVVQPGDTIWSIAVQQCPGVDPRWASDEIERLNHVDGTAHIVPGQVLKLPGS